MATKKSKPSNKSAKTKTTKSKTAEAPVKKAEIKAETIITEEAEVTEVSEPVSTNTKKDTKEDEVKSRCLKGFFARKYDEKESILTVFKSHKFYGALLGEAIGTMLIALLLLSLSLMGIANVATYSFAVIAIFIAVYAFSGACLNPIVAAGMMASRRISVIRGVMYIIAEIIGAWLGWLIFNAFHLAGGDTAYDMVAMSEIAEGGFWVTTMVEFVGAAIIAFFFARAVEYKRSVFTFGAIIAGGIALAVIVGYVVSAAFLGLSSNFILNPAVALMMNIFPTAGENFGEIIGGICQALAIYAIFPMIGGVIGFYLSDFTAKLSGNKQ